MANSETLQLSQGLNFRRPEIPSLNDVVGKARESGEKVRTWRDNLRLEGVLDPRIQHTQNQETLITSIAPLAPADSSDDEGIPIRALIPNPGQTFSEAHIIPIRHEEPLDTPERTKAVKLRSIRPTDYAHILRWAADSETRGHLDPPPSLPASWVLNDPSTWSESGNDYEEALHLLDLYYKNLDVDPEKRKRQNPTREAGKITPLVAVNADDEPLGVSTIRWKGDPYAPRGKTASIERVIVNPDPEYRGKGTGRLLFVQSIDYAFRHGYRHSGAEEVRAWVLTDREAGDFQKNIVLMQSLGFVLVHGDWSEHKRKYGMDDIDNRYAIWFSIKPNKWLKKLESDPKVQECVKIPIELDQAA